MEMIENQDRREVIGVTSVKVLGDYRVALTFTDGTAGELDLEPYLWGPVFEPLRANKDLFRSVSVDPEAQTIIWPNDADIAPETLYEDRHPTRLKKTRASNRKAVPSRQATKHARR